MVCPHAEGRTHTFQHNAAIRERLRQTSYVRPGPGSVTWRVNRERIVVAGWGRAILLQLAHPSIAAGVHDHSSFRGSLLATFRRMHSTVGAMLALTFGDTEEMIAAATRINAIHDRVNGPLDHGTRNRYSAHDPDLQRWVHATLLESIPLTYELLVGPLTPQDRDRYCAEASIMEPLLGMQCGSLPRTRSELDAYMRDMRTGGSLRITDVSRELARAVLYPPQWGLAWPAFRPAQLLTLATLPPAIRSAYGFKWGAREARAFTRWATVLRASLRVLPPLVREWSMVSRPGR